MQHLHYILSRLQDIFAREALKGTLLRSRRDPRPICHCLPLRSIFLRRAILRSYRRILLKPHSRDEPINLQCSISSPRNTVCVLRNAFKRPKSSQLNSGHPSTGKHSLIVVTSAMKIYLRSSLVPPHQRRSTLVAYVLSRRNKYCSGDRSGLRFVSRPWFVHQSRSAWKLLFHRPRRFM
jgi:hypothetical protein